MRPWSVFVRHAVVSLQVLARSHRGSLGRLIRCDRRGARCDRSGGPLQAIGRGARGDPAGAFQFSTLPPAAYGFADSASSLIDTTGGPSISSDLTSVGALDRARHRFPVLEQLLWDTTSVLPLWRLDLGPTRGPGSRRGGDVPRFLFGSGMSVDSTGDQLFLFGGCSRIAPYDPSNGIWSTPPSSPRRVTAGGDKPVAMIDVFRLTDRVLGKDRARRRLHPPRRCLLPPCAAATLFPNSMEPTIMIDGRQP